MRRKDIEKIQNAILICKDSFIWVGFVKSLKMISENIWTRPTHYILEFLQNAEDATRLNKNEGGYFNLNLSKNKIKITHGGSPFSLEDLNAICNVNSSKKPETGTIGYLGIGFKSVFRISDSPEIYSNDYWFRFNKQKCEETFGTNFPWHIYPWSIGKITEKINLKETSFIIPFRDSHSYELTKKEVIKFGVHLFLFLKWIRKIEINDEETESPRIFEHFPGKLTKISDEVKWSISTFIEGSSSVKFLVFFGKFKVPEAIQKDRKTIEAERNKITQREVAIAFRLDESEHLSTELPGKMYGGLYSFLPLEEVRTGAKFLIQADFLVQPGRDGMIWDAAWNKWLIEKISEVSLVAIEHFQKDDQWRGEYIPLFEFETLYDDFYENLIAPILKHNIEEKLKEQVVPRLSDNQLISIDKAVQVTDEIKEFLKDGYIDNEHLTLIYGEELFLIDENIKTGNQNVKELKLRNLDNEDFLRKKIEEGTAIEFLCRYYKAINQRNIDLTNKFIITEKNQVKMQREAYIKEIPDKVEELKRKNFNVDEVLQELDFIHPELMNRIRDFLVEVKKITYSKICKDVVLPKIRAETETPKKKIVLTCAHLLKAGEINPSEIIWIINKNGKVMLSENIFISDKYEPLHKWEAYDKITEINYLSEDYLKMDDDVEGWKTFFEREILPLKGRSGLNNSTPKMGLLIRLFGGILLKLVAWILPDSLRLKDHDLFNFPIFFK